LTPPLSSPVYETSRLRLRGVLSEDEEAIYDLLSAEQVVRFMRFPLFTRERAQRFVARLQAPPSAGEPLQRVLAIAECSRGATIGLCGLVLRPDVEQGEVWYLLQPAWWGQGLATEAVHVLVEHGFRHMALHRIWASCLPENPASARVLEKLGFRREGLLRQNLRIQGQWRDSYLYAVLATEWATYTRAHAT
jgi:ribosomal-protein-alanine N-acetyltransferase